jgi:hypothetical protein
LLGKVITGAEVGRRFDRSVEGERHGVFGGNNLIFIWR